MFLCFLKLLACLVSGQGDLVVEWHGFSGCFHYLLACFQKTSEEQLAELQRLHAEELASREQELARKLQTRERELHEQMKIALVSAVLSEVTTKLPCTQVTWGPAAPTSDLCVCEDRRQAERAGWLSVYEIQFLRCPAVISRFVCLPLSILAVGNN